MSKSKSDFAIVGIGASAGGLDAYKELLRSLPTDTGAAFILIQHLDPNHESMMADLLARHTKMRVMQAENDMALEPDTVYVIPPGKFIRLIDHGLFLDDPVQERGIRMAIDYFFRSLAETRGEKSIAIVLSGTGSDGTLGIREVKAAGGMVMVQKPADADYDGMPRSAIATGIVDFVLPVEEMGRQLVQFLRHPYLSTDERKAGLSEKEPDSFKSILTLLRQHTDYDFNSYKKGTVERRIQRRMGLKQIKELDQYVSFLKDAPEEVNLLFRDLLIGVTRFFREPDAWELFGDKAVEKIISRKPKGVPIRAWVPGCASGEEAYTLAMVLFDRLDKLNKRTEVQIFATDLNDRAIEAARSGRYASSIETDVPDAFLKKYFIDDGDHFRVNKRLRETVVFASQNVISDPPFSKLDLITCRNLMIYLDADVQRQMIEMFHFALADNGYLFLGNSETAERPGRLFEAIDKPNRIYRRSDVARVRTGSFPIIQSGRHQEKSLAKHDKNENYVTSVDQAKRFLLDRFAPASVLVDSSFEVSYFHGPVRNYLDFPKGEPTQRILDIVLPELKGKLRTVLNTVSGGRQSGEALAHKVRRNGHHVSVRVSAEAVTVHENDRRNYLVFFQDVSEPVDTDEEQKAFDRAREKASPEERGQVEALEYELQSTREDLQSTIEEMETANEELKASNEEVMSMNEELQSTNEELETSREELQSLNEELSTVNSQLEDKVGEVEAANNDLTNLLTSTNIAVIFLDANMIIRRFTPAIREIMRIIESDVGRPVEDIALRVQDEKLVEDAKTCLDTLSESEEVVETDTGKHLIRRLRPYRTTENRIEGIVVTYTNVTSLHKAREQAKVREKQQQAVAELGRMALAGGPLQELFDQAMEAVAKHLNVRYAKLLKLEEDRQAFALVSGVGWKDGIVGKTRIDAGIASQAGYTLMRTTPVIVEDFREEKRFNAPALLKDHHILCGASVIIGPVTDPWGVLGAHESEVGRCGFSIDDINFLQSISAVLWLAISSVAARESIEAKSAQLRELTDALPIRFAIVGEDQRYEFVNVAYESSGLPREKIEGMSVREVLGETAYETAEKYIARALAGEEQKYELQLNLPDGGDPQYNLVSYMPRYEGDRVNGFYSAAIDINEQKAAQRESVERSAQYRLVGESIPFGVWTCDPDGKLTYVSDSFLEMVGMRFEDAAEFGWAEKLAEDSGEETLQAWAECRETGGNWEREHRFVDKDGKVRHVLALGRPVHDENGIITSWAGFNLDITRRKEQEERMATVSAELDHRVKNILATVSTIARMTGRNAASLDEYRNSLEARLYAMATAHQVLAESGWRGMSLEELLKKELSPYLSQESANISISGPTINLLPGTAQSLALAFHELTTNAAKYGALNEQAGRLDVSWDWNHNPHDRVTILWSESGLAGVQEPTSEGFGTTVLEKVLTAQLNAQVDIAYRPEGIEVCISLPGSVLTR